MALSQRLDLRQTQALVMTPQLQQAIKLLQLSNLELSTFVETELEQNPLLERDEGGGDGPAEGEAMGGPAEELPAVVDAPEPSLAATEPGLSGDDVDSWSAAAGSDGQGDVDIGGDPDAFRQSSGGESLDGLPDLGETLTKGITLREHLLGQVSVDLGDPADRVIGAHLVEMVDETGYLTGDLETVAVRLGCDVARVEKTLALVQRFDPPGVFARNLAECLALQLIDRNRFDPAMQALIANLPMLANRDLTGLMRVCQVDQADLADMIAEVKSLDPKPGLSFDPITAQAVTPDILMRLQSDGSWLVELNNDTLPRVLVNTRYFAIASKGARDKTEKEYLADRLQSANWLVKSLHQRATTILRVATEIVRQQELFFQHGVRHLRPLILRDIAAAISMHESTVSRVTTNKYLASPRGIFELKYFFTSAIPSADGGDAHSAEAVRSRIKTLIDAEDVNGVLSDERIVEILQKDGVDIARRTVAKYRESLRIPSSLQRRRAKSTRVLAPG